MIPVILASKSAVRAQLLAGAGVAFEAVGSQVDEDLIKQDLLAQGRSPLAIASGLAEAKALAVSNARPGLVIGADQTLEFEGRLYDKAPDLSAARERLLSLSGKSHQLHAALVVAQDGVPLWREVSTATLTMRRFSEAFLDDYLATEGPEALGSVGCYRLEGPGVQLFSRIEGDYFGILGLPLIGLLDLLRERGALAS